MVARSKNGSFREFLIDPNTVFLVSEKKSGSETHGFLKEDTESLLLLLSRRRCVSEQEEPFLGFFE